MNLDDVMQQVHAHPQKTIAVAAADNEKVIEGIKEALDCKLGSFRLYGDEEKIRLHLHDAGLSEYNHIKVIPTRDMEESARLAVTAVRSGKADILMKGMLPTSDLLKSVLNRDYGLRTNKTLSHVAMFEIPDYERFIFLTDSAMNIAPDLTKKADIIANAVYAARAMGFEHPKVAALAAVEVVNPDMQSTLDAAVLTAMNNRGQIKHCTVDGPLALDNAISIEAAVYKGIQGEVAGRADILLVPTVEIGNTLYKSLVYFSKAKVGGIIAGAKAPIVLTSRADSNKSKLYSIAMACHMIEFEQNIAAGGH